MSEKLYTRKLIMVDDGIEVLQLSIYSESQMQYIQKTLRILQNRRKSNAHIIITQMSAGCSGCFGPLKSVPSISMVLLDARRGRMECQQNMSQIRNLTSLFKLTALSSLLSPADAFPLHLPYTSFPTVAIFQPSLDSTSSHWIQHLGNLFNRKES